MMIIRTRRHVWLVAVVTDDPAVSLRRVWESTVCRRLSDAGVAVSIVELSDAGCILAVDEYDLDAVRKAAKFAGAALRVRMRCARIAISRRGGTAPVAFVAHIVSAMAESRVAVQHIVTDAETVSLLIDERDALCAQSQLAHLCGAHVGKNPVVSSAPHATTVALIERRRAAAKRRPTAMVAPYGVAVHRGRHT
jgi:aspartokinase